MFADNEVQNRVIETRQEFAPGQLEQVANYLNAHFAGLPLAEIRTRLLLELRDARSELEQLLAHSIELAEQALQPPADDMLVAGQTRLMGQDLSDLERLRTVRAVLQQARDPAAAGADHPGAGRAHLHRRETGMMPLQGVSLVPVHRQRPGAGRAGRDRSQADGLRPRDPAGPGHGRCSARPFHRPRARRKHPTLETQHPPTRVVGGGV